MGLFLLLAGPRGIELGRRASLERTPEGRISPRVWAIVIVLVGLGVVLRYWLDQRLASFGYG